ncbi:GNAT family N-acetyltransferase, partial [Pseudomonas aeruginosa]|uniref:GNAT family N-acetyltransferase n=1 Tax=Pseudomonas aeruginosa TaxID=287 RepID=UPI003CF049F3
RASGEMVFDAEREIYFPQRPPRPQGEVYRRYDPRIRRMLSFRIADPVSDAERFTRWMNDPRVEYFWEQSGSLEVQIAYLERQLTSKHAFPLIGCFDDRPFSYFEIYWAAEDRSFFAIAGTAFNDLTKSVIHRDSIGRAFMKSLHTTADM